MRLLASLCFLAVPLNGMLIESPETPEIEMADVGRLERHSSHLNLLHFSLFFRDKVTNNIQVDTLFVRRIIRRTRDGVTIEFGGMRETTPGPVAYLNRSQAALHFHQLTREYGLLQRTPEQWLALSQN